LRWSACLQPAGGNSGNNRTTPPPMASIAAKRELRKAPRSEQYLVHTCKLDRSPKNDPLVLASGASVGSAGIVASRVAESAGKEITSNSNAPTSPRSGLWSRSPSRTNPESRAVRSKNWRNWSSSPKPWGETHYWRGGSNLGWVISAKRPSLQATVRLTDHPQAA
jgi:hypothetical protein